jgi:hypothetical protein
MSNLTPREQEILGELEGSHGMDYLILELVRSSARRLRAAGVYDPATLHVTQKFEEDVRRAIAQRKESSELVTFRRDWDAGAWESYLRHERFYLGLALFSECVAALENAGCQCAADVVSTELTRDGKAKRRAVGSRSTEDWLRVLRAEDARLENAASYLDASWLLVSMGCSTPLSLLFRNAGRLAPNAARLVAAAPAEVREQELPASDINDTSVFETE